MVSFPINTTNQEEQLLSSTEEDKVTLKLHYLFKCYLTLDSGNVKARECMVLRNGVFCCCLDSGISFPLTKILLSIVIKTANKKEHA